MGSLIIISTSSQDSVSTANAKRKAISLGSN